MTRTITTAAELDALPAWAAVEDVLGVAWVKHPAMPGRADGWVSYYGDRMSAQYVAAESPLTVLHDPSAPAVPVVPVVSNAAVSRGLAQSAAGETVDLGDFTQYLIPDAAVEAFKAAWHHTDAEGRSGERVRDGLAAALPLLGAAPSATREDVRDEIAGHPIGSGYYANSVSVEEAFEIADALLDRFKITSMTDR